jgi:superfamily I DNA and RNA helicase
MRKTENELRKLQVAGFYRDIDLGTPDNVLDEVEKKIAEKMGFRATSDDRFKLLAMNGDLDLEGYERFALAGAKETISSSRPKLAISAYHRPDDLIEITKFIRSVRSDYKVGVQHHTFHRWDTCLYFY